MLIDLLYIKKKKSAKKQTIQTVFPKYRTQFLTKYTYIEICENQFYLFY